MKILKGTNGQHDGGDSPDDSRYTNARRSWNEVNGHHINQKRNWQYAFFGMIPVLLFALAITNNALRQPRLQPYVIYADRADRRIHVAQVTPIDVKNPTTDEIVKWTLIHFIESLRMVSFDPTVEQKATHENVEPFLNLNTQATNLATEWDRGQRKAYHDHSVSLTSTAEDPTRYSPGVYQVTWTEVVRNTEGRILTTQHWLAVINVQINQSSTDNSIPQLDPLNPFGIKVTSIDWKLQSTDNPQANGG